MLRRVRTFLCDAARTGPNAAIPAVLEERLRRLLQLAHTPAHGSGEVKRARYNAFERVLDARGDVAMPDLIALLDPREGRTLPSTFIPEIVKRYTHSASRADVMDTIRWLLPRPATLGPAAVALLTLLQTLPAAPGQPSNAVVCHSVCQAAYQGGVDVEWSVLRMTFDECVAARRLDLYVDVPQRQSLKGQHAQFACQRGMALANALGQPKRGRGFFDALVEGQEAVPDVWMLSELVRGLPASVDAEAFIGPWLRGTAVGWAGPVAPSPALYLTLLARATSLHTGNRIYLEAVARGIQLCAMSYHHMLRMALESGDRGAVSKWYNQLIARYMPKEATLVMLAEHAAQRCASVDDGHMTMLESLVDMIAVDMLRAVAERGKSRTAAAPRDDTRAALSCLARIRDLLGAVYARLGMHNDLTALNAAVDAIQHNVPAHKLAVADTSEIDWDGDYYRECCAQVALEHLDGEDDAGTGRFDEVGGIQHARAVDV